MGTKYGRGGWIRTNAWQDQNLLPYRLATPLYLVWLTAYELRCTLWCNGRGGWIRTNAWQDQNLLPYRLATPL